MESIERFLEAQERDYSRALSEIKAGKKTSHWIWYIFPQIDGLGFSSTARYYAIKDLEEAIMYYKNDTLRSRLIEISQELLKHKDKSSVEILGDVDSLKVCSCMTLFDIVAPNQVFKEVLDVFYQGKRDVNTLYILNKKG